jgi:hypothetical protein
LDDLRGCYPILATPFTPDGEIDNEGVARLVRHFREAAAHDLRDNRRLRRRGEVPDRLRRIAVARRALAWPPGVRY